MAATRVTEDGPSAGGPDDLDALLSYDLDEADTRALELAAAQAPQHANVNPTSSSANPNSSGAAAAAAAADTSLNLNEEVKIVKRREPVAKLDETRLLSGAGIPKLRHMAGTTGAGTGTRSARSRNGGKKGRGVSKGLGIRGKRGEEFEDVARMLARYQLWMDDLYPRAKMADALIMVEKLGHSKRMQMLRKEWIDEGKPRDRDDDDDGREEAVEGVVVAGRDEGGEEAAAAAAANGGVMITGDGDGADDSDDDGGMFVPMNPGLGSGAGSRAEGQQAAATTTTTTGAADDVPMEDELDALLAEEGNESATAATAAPAQTTTTTAASRADDSPMDDDLDALLAEEEDIQNNADASGTSTAPKTAAAATVSGTSTQPAGKTAHSTTQATSFEDDYADDMDVMRDLW